MSTVHQLRRRVREALRNGRRQVGTFLKLPSPDVVELAGAAGLDLVVVDLEHSTLTERDAIDLVRHADRCELPALVRLPRVDPALVVRLLENGAAGFQLSTLRSAAEARSLREACRFAPSGTRSVSLANRVAGFGSVPLGEVLHLEDTDPPLLVGQIETRVEEPLAEVVRGLDVAFVGTTDLAVSLGLPAPAELAAAVAAVASAAVAADVAFGGWAPGLADLDRLGLGDASYALVGSDLQLLAHGLRAVVHQEEA
ncbi:HpcH/HpaI aldolase family protein [Nocardioides nitrophenolicus]|uniref:HpcH/HpaI aldolase family protein n=1 Tax=Nocardioides nitrophenolicus TaxID=60489 RepID=UPI00195D6295|nr:aldolase/citrate lyase family protein [Nocardioides nitrophenolicus]MBM7516992.1 4-hydroxy-2-oxoheptanedioate aldolase [Nocardioides nitrophenolicus]